MEQVINRIKKLYALGNDPNATEGERMNALERAAEMMLKYNVESLDVEEVKFIEGNIIHDAVTHKYEIILAQAVATLFNCRTVRWRDGDMKFVGKPLNVQSCEETWSWVVNQVEELYKQGLVAFKNAKGGWLSVKTRGEFRKTFKEACAIRVHRRVAEIIAKQRNQIPQHMALVVIEQTLEGIDAQLEKAGVKSTKLRPIAFGHGTGAGLNAGDQVQLQEKVQ